METTRAMGASRRTAMATASVILPLFLCLCAISLSHSVELPPSPDGTSASLILHTRGERVKALNYHYITISITSQLLLSYFYSAKQSDIVVVDSTRGSL